jgi:hypothetical protein
MDWLASLCQDLAATLQTVLTWSTGSPIDNPAQPDLQNPTPAGLLASTPPVDSYAQPVVVQYWCLCRDIADTAFALLILLAGLEIVASTRVGRSHDGALDGLRRLGLVAMLANISLPAIGLVIDLGNVLCSAVGGVAMPDLQSLGLAGSTLQDVILSLAYTVVAVLLVVQLLVRLALLDLLIIVAPLGLLCWASPRAHHWARLWTHLVVATALQQFLQVLALRVSIDLLTHLPGATDDPVITPLLGCASFLVVLRLPRLLRGSSVLGAVPTLATIAGTLAAPAPRAAAAAGAHAPTSGRGVRP